MGKYVMEYTQQKAQLLLKKYYFFFPPTLVVQKPAITEMLFLPAVNVMLYGIDPFRNTHCLGLFAYCSAVCYLTTSPVFYNYYFQDSFSGQTIVDKEFTCDRHTGFVPPQLYDFRIISPPVHHPFSNDFTSLTQMSQNIAIEHPG